MRVGIRDKLQGIGGAERSEAVLCTQKPYSDSHSTCDTLLCRQRHSGGRAAEGRCATVPGLAVCAAEEGVPAWQAGLHCYPTVLGAPRPGQGRTSHLRQPPSGQARPWSALSPESK